MAFLHNLSTSHRFIAALVTIIATCLSTSIYSATFPPNTKYELCFTPGNDCTSMIVNEIGKANKSIYIQAYSFTSQQIAKAISDARTKGLDVKVILDKRQIGKNKYSSAKYLINQHVPAWIDYKPAIAHNKIIIIDNSTVITGSFNFTKAAQEKNAENVLIIHDSGLAKSYIENFSRRKYLSKKISTSE